jgi:predicted porin
MNKSLVAAALLGACAGVAQAQSNVQIYGTIDAGIIKRTDQSLNIGKRAANTLGFKGSEELGNGLKAIFQLEMRYEPDTGTQELGTSTVNGVTTSVARPLFQGQSRVGLQGDFGMVRIGRGLSPFQESVAYFDPWHGLPTPAGFWTDLSVAGFTTDPLGTPGTSGNRMSNGLFYNSPSYNGFQFNGAVSTKESNSGNAIIGRGTAAVPQYPANAQPSTNPFSLSGTYNNGPMGAMLAYERNAVESKVWSLGASVLVTPELKLMGTYSSQDREHTFVSNSDVKAWVLGANYTMGPGKLLVGYGRKTPDGQPHTKQLSLGYEYSLSKRTYLYVDASRKEGPIGNATSTTTINHYDVGVNHSF